MSGTRSYYTVVIPAAPMGLATKWHPTGPGSGPGEPFNVIVRGVFESEGLAILWAAAHLDGTPYSVRLVAWEEFPADDSGWTYYTACRGLAASIANDGIDCLAGDYAHE